MENQIKGAVVVDKPANLYTGDIVEKVKRRFKVKVGHTGVIDFVGSGVVVLLINNATRISYFLLNADKEYIATGLLGKRTDTMDITGTVLEEKDYTTVTQEKIEKVLSCFTGEINLPVPIFSNKKWKGMRLYKLAREGKQSKVEEVPGFFSRVKIYTLELVNFDLPYFTIKVRCSKGTYIRSLIDCIGKSLEVGALMYSLRRVAVGHLTIDKAITFEKIMAMDFNGFKQCIIPINEVLKFLPEVEIKSNYLPLFLNGVTVPIGTGEFKSDYIKVTFMGELVGIGLLYNKGVKWFVRMYKKC